MNRTIKFRGKCSPQSKYKGEWVTGSLVVPEQIKDNEVLIVVAHSDNCKSTYHVDKDTIGQFTEFQFNGIDIYEHDVFRFKDEYYEVVYNENIAAFAFLNIATQRVGVVPFVNVLIIVKMEYIGNIHDNTELIQL